MSKGKDFEKLIAAVEEGVHDFPEARVLHNVMLPTKYGGKRQIDILILENRGRFEYKTIIECKNTSSKVSVNTVGAFKELLDSVDAHQGIIVSAAGFQKGAFQSAKQENIFLYQFSQLKELRSHLQSFRFNIFEVTHTSKDFTVRFKEKKDINRKLTIHDELHAPSFNIKTSLVKITEDFLQRSRPEITDKLIRRVTNPLIEQLITGKTEIKIEFPIPILYVKNGDVTEIIGFDTILHTEFFTAPTTVKSISEYKDVVKSTTHAFVFEVEFEGERFKILRKEN